MDLHGLYREQCSRYDVDYKIIPVLPYMNCYTDANIRMMNVGLNAYLERDTIDKEGSDLIYSKRWSKWAENVKVKKNGGDDGSQGFHRYVGKQSRIFASYLNQPVGEYWTNFVKIYLSDIDGKKESKLDAKHLLLSRDIFEKELDFLDGNNLLPNIMIVYGNKVWEHAIIPIFVNNNEKFTCTRRFGYCSVKTRKTGFTIHVCRLTHPANMKKYLTAENTINKYGKLISECTIL